MRQNECAVLEIISLVLLWLSPTHKILRLLNLQGYVRWTGRSRNVRRWSGLQAVFGFERSETALIQARLLLLYGLL